MDKEQKTKQEVINKLKGMTIQEAKELCEEYGWEIKEGKYFLECADDEVVFNSDKELIDYAITLKGERED